MVTPLWKTEWRFLETLNTDALNTVAGDGHEETGLLHALLVQRKSPFKMTHAP